jgi:hypothetical protein
VGREVRPLRQVEIVDEHKPVPVVARQNEVGAGLLEMRAEQKLRVVDFDMIGRRPFRQPRHVRMIGVLDVTAAQHPKPPIRSSANGSNPKSQKKPRGRDCCSGIQRP